MKDYNSVLQFLEYRVNEIELKNNDDFKDNGDKIPINLSIVPTIKVQGQNMSILLNTEIFKDSKQNNYPFEMTIKLTGYFKCEGESPEKFAKNAIAILYPYIRSIVSTYTANANIYPLILPTINVNKLVEDQEK